MDAQPTRESRRRLTTTQHDKVFGGVCGGVAEYTGLDPGLVRIVTVIAVCSGIGVLVPAYFALMIFLPKSYVPTRVRTSAPRLPKLKTSMGGWLLLGLGTWILLEQVDWINVKLVAALALIALGVNLVVRKSD